MLVKQGGFNELTPMQSFYSYYQQFTRLLRLLLLQPYSVDLEQTGVGMETLLQRPMVLFSSLSHLLSCSASRFSLKFSPVLDVSP